MGPFQSLSHTGTSEAHNISTSHKEARQNRGMKRNSDFLFQPPE